MRTSPDKINRVVPAGVLGGIEELSTQPRQDIRQQLGTMLTRAPLISYRVAAAFMRVFEFLVVGLSGYLLAAFYPGLTAPVSPELYLIVILMASAALPLIAEALKLYTVHAVLNPFEHTTRLATAWTLIFAAIAVAVFMTKAGHSYSRVWLGTWYLTGLLALAAGRMVAAALVRRWNRNGRLDRRAVLVGGGEAAAKLISALKNSSNADVSVVGIFDDRDDQRSPPVENGLPKLGNIGELVDFVRRARIDMLIVVLPLSAEARLLQVLKRLWVLPVDIRLSAYSQRLRYRPRAYSYIGNVPLLDVFDKPIGDWGGLLKAIEDKVISFLALLLLAPIMLMVALAVKLESKGPVFFKQKRYGFNNDLIEVYKFRSMFHEMRDADANRLATRNDPRVTRVGRFIRKSSLDELPQLFNVLRGELSLVGPRPHPTKAKAANQLYDDVVDGYFARHRVKPGITGWAQVNGWRGETDTAEKLQRRIEHDLYYIENWSLAFDLKILLRTPIALFKTEDAY